jgi:hypothetical protein
MGRKARTFFSQLISEKDAASSRRFVTLVISGLFIATCITILVLLIILFICVTRLQGINIPALTVICELLKEIIKYEAIIVFGGLGFITTPQLAAVLKNFFSKRDSWFDRDEGFGGRIGRFDNDRFETTETNGKVEEV